MSYQVNAIYTFDNKYETVLDWKVNNNASPTIVNNYLLSDDSQLSTLQQTPIYFLYWRPLSKL